MVAIRHTSSTDQHRTTLILLCEDGSLRIYMANVDSTGFWMAPLFQASSAISTLKPVRKKKVTNEGRTGVFHGAKQLCSVVKQLHVGSDVVVNVGFICSISIEMDPVG